MWEDIKNEKTKGDITTTTTDDNNDNIRANYV